MALVRVPFYFINLLPTSLLYISILLTDDTLFTDTADEGYCAGIPVVMIRAKDGAELLALGRSS